MHMSMVLLQQPVFQSCVISHATRSAEQPAGVQAHKSPDAKAGPKAGHSQGGLFGGNFRQWLLAVA